MTYTVVWVDEAFGAAQTYMTDDPDGLAQVFDAVDLLADEPRPAGAFAWGVDRFRIHIGRYRVMYEVTDTTVTVEVMHLGRTG
ncbi:MAG: type II toxin-antitoxin system RelE family toxin [Nocardioidaceae bacterium]